MISAAEAVLQRAGVLNPKATVLVALSGGADSVALLYTLLALGKRHGPAVRAAHVEHGLRGEESLADAAFCEALCKRLGVPFTCDSADLPGDADSPGMEAAAREARYALLLARARECGADALLLAHHQDDQAETVLQHLLRGSGARGLSGMDEITHRNGVLLCRPFLSLPKQALLDALGSEPYRTDESNLRPVCQRNRLRLTILPELVMENPAAVSHIAQSAALLRLDEHCLQSQADQVLEQAMVNTPPYFCLRRDLLKKADAAVALRVLRKFAEIGAGVRGISAEALSLSAADSMALLGLLGAAENATLNLPGALHATATQHFIHLTRMEDDALLRDLPALTPIRLDGDTQPLIFGGIALHMMPHAPGGLCPDGRRTVVLTREQMQAAVVRQPRPGDTIHPFGADGKKPLRRYLTDKKLDPPFRKSLPVVAIGKEVLWAVGVGAAESTRIRKEPSMLLTLKGSLPWLIIHSSQRSSL